MRIRLTALFAAASMVVVLAACAEDKSYDIGPIFPLSSDKCAEYGGDEEGSGPTASCMVTKDQCEKAAADWRNAMESRGIRDAIQFSCN